MGRPYSHGSNSRRGCRNPSDFEPRRAVTGIEKLKPEYPISKENSRSAAVQKRWAELWAVYNDRQSALGSPAPVFVYCDNCYGPIPGEHYHCSICEDGNFDLCPGCIEDGVLCGGDDHRMIKRYIKNGKIITSNTESLEPRNARNESKIILVEGRLFYIPWLLLIIYQSRNIDSPD